MRPEPSLPTHEGSSELLRRRNLGFVLRRVHVQPRTRSELTRASGLNRSTIGTLVNELVDRGLVVEDDAASSGLAGRPSPVVRPSDVPLAVAVNPEIDAVTVATVRLGGRVLATQRVPFAERVPTPEEAVEATVEAVRLLRAQTGPEHRVVGMGVAVPGIVRRADGVVRLAPHLGWRHAPIGRMLADALHIPVDVANDASLGARAEWIFGAGRGVDDLVYLNGGASGVGGGVVVQGMQIGGADGHAGEMGHTAVRRGGDADTVGLRGTLESEVSRSRLLELLGAPHLGPAEFERALLADHSHAMRTEVRRQIDALAIAVANAAHLLNPSRVILGGLLADLFSAAPARLRTQVDARMLPALDDPIDIRRAELGTDLLSIGAAELPFARLIEAASG